MANNNKKDKLFDDLVSTMKKADDALESLKASVDTLQNGDGNFPYWNGSNAHSILKNTLTQYYIDKSLLENISNCKLSSKISNSLYRM